MKPKGTSMRGFASLSPEERTRVSRIGAMALHEQGKAHQFTKKEAKAAGKVGGKISGIVRKAKGKD